MATVINFTDQEAETFTARAPAMAPPMVFTEGTTITVNQMPTVTHLDMILAGASLVAAFGGWRRIGIGLALLGVADVAARKLAPEAYARAMPSQLRGYGARRRR